jgi:hypothetical protein
MLDRRRLEQRRLATLEAAEMDLKETRIVLERELYRTGWPDDRGNLFIGLRGSTGFVPFRVS